MGILAACCVKVVSTFNVSYLALRLELFSDFSNDTCSGKSSTLTKVQLTLTSEIYNKSLPIEAFKPNLMAFEGQPPEQCKL